MAPYLAAAAVLALVTISAVVMRKQRDAVETPLVPVAQSEPPAVAPVVRAVESGRATPTRR